MNTILAHVTFFSHVHGEDASAFLVGAWALAVVGAWAIYFATRGRN